MGESSDTPLKLQFDRRARRRVEWHQGELFPSVGSDVTNLSLPAEGVTHS